MASAFGSADSDPLGPDQAEQADPRPRSAGAASTAEEAGAPAVSGSLRAQEAQVRSNPSDHLAAYQLALLHGERDQPGEAIRWYKEAVSRRADFSQAYYNMGLCYVKQQNWEEAEIAYREAIRIDAEDSEYWANLGALLERKASHDEALEAYRKAERLDPNDALVRHRLGRFYLSLGEYEAARTTLEQATTLAPKDPQGWNHLGLVLFHLGDDDAARKHYERAIDLDSSCAAAWNNLGNYYQVQGQWEEAERAYRRAVKESPKDASAWFNLGEFYLNHDHPETEKCIKEALKLDREDLEAWDLLRQWYRRQKQYKPWRSVLRILLAREPQRRSLREELATLCTQLGDTTEAIALLEDLLTEADPQTSQYTKLETQFLSLLLQQGSLARALTHLKERKRDAPSSSSAPDDGEALTAVWYEMGQRFLHQKKPNEAEDCFLSVISHDPHHADSWQFLGELAWQRSQPHLALERFLRATEVNENQVDLWLPMAEQFSGRQEHEQALQCLQQLDISLWQPHQWDRCYAIHTRAERGTAFLEALKRGLQSEFPSASGWAQLASLYEQHGDPIEAGKALEAASTLLHPSEDNALIRARYHQTRNEWDQALALWRTLEDARKDDPNYWMQRGLAAYQSDHFSEAESCYRALLAAQPGHWQALFQLGNACFYQQKWDEAKDAFGRVTALQPLLYKGWYNLGCVHERAKAWRAAQRCFEQTLSLKRDMAWAWNWMGTLHERQGNLQKARMAYLRALASHRQLASSWHNLGTLFARQGQQGKARKCLEQAQQNGLHDAGATTVVRSIPLSLTA